MFLTKVLTRFAFALAMLVLSVIAIQPAYALGNLQSYTAIPPDVMVQVPFQGNFQGIENHIISFPTMTLDGDGWGTATLLGSFSFQYTGVVDLLTATSTGLSMQLVAANGDVLYAEGYGQATPTATTSYVTEWYTITGGTGRFAGATGSFTSTRQVNRATGAMEGSLDGTLVLAAGQ